MNLNSRLARLEREWIVGPKQDDGADDGAGIWISWPRGAVDGECLRNGGEPEPSAQHEQLLFLSWLASLTDVEDGDHFNVVITNMGTCKWHVDTYGQRVQDHLKAMWHDGMQFVSLAGIADLKRMSPLELEALAAELVAAEKSDKSDT